MEWALINGPGSTRVHIRDFARYPGRRYAELGFRPTCEACGAAVHPVNLHHPDLDKRFDHADRDPAQDPLDACALSNAGRRFRGLRAVAFDGVRELQIRAEFIEDGPLCMAYAFALSLCGRGNLPAATFAEMIRRADRRRVWAYAGIEAWTLPYILLTLANFRGRSPRGAYGFHFVFETPRGLGASGVLTEPRRCSLLKTFDDGKPMRGHDNPLELSPQILEERSGDPAWVSSKVLPAVRALLRG